MLKYLYIIVLTSALHPAFALEPVFKENFPDPSIIQGNDGKYYGYATQGANSNIELIRSTNLTDWERLPDAMPQKPRWASTQQNFWSPDVSLHDGIYYLYFAGESNQLNYCIGSASSRSPAGPFKPEDTPLACGPGINDIDPTSFDDPVNGSHLLYFGSGGAPIRVIQLSRDRLHGAEGAVEKPVLFPSDRDYEHLIEGARVDYHDGFYFLYYSGDNCCHIGPHYAELVARARSPFGPFEQAPNPLVVSEGEWLAPGHGSILTDSTGITWLFVHAIDQQGPESIPDMFNNGGVPPRILLRQRLNYVDGWPQIVNE